MKLMKRTVSVFLAILMLLGSFSVLASATVVDGYGDTITFDIKFYRNTGTADAPVWTETTKAAPGESIRARFFIDTDYVFGASTIFFLYDKKAIVMDTTNYVQPSLGYTIVGNTEAGTVVGDNNISGEFTFSTSQTGIGDDLVYYEILPEGTFDDYGFAYFAFNSGKAAALSGDEWAFELHYNVAETPSEKAQIYMPAETVVLPSGDDNNWDAAATVLGRNHEDDVGGSLVSAGFQESYDWDVDPVIVNNDKDADSTLTFKSKITFNANGGTLTGDATSEGYIKAAATAPAVTAPAGSEFIGWVPSTVENPTEADVVTTFAYDYADTSYTALYKTTAAETSAYTVNVYEMDVDGNYPADPTVVPDTTGVVGAEVTYTPTINEGFYLDAKSTEGLKTTVTTDETDVIDVYLARKAQTVKYVDENGNAIDGLADAKYYYGKTYNVAAEVAKTGYKWAGWTADGATVTAGSEVTAKPAADGETVTYKAAYTADANTVTIQGVYTDAKLGGDVELEPYTVNTTTGYTVKVVDAVPEETEDNVTYVLKSALPTAEHYQIPAGEYEIAVADDGKAVLEITYEAKSYTYKFVDEDDSVIKTATVPYYTSVEAPEGEDKPEAGKLFKNWVSGDKTLEALDTFNIDADVTYTAAYEDEIFYVYYTVEGEWPDGFEQIEDKEITFGDEVVLPVVDDVPGYTFSGWEVVSGATKNDEGKWIAGASDVDVTATWTHDKYTITFYLDETSEEPYASGVLYYGDLIEAPTPDQSEILGQKFLGWAYEDETGAALGEITTMPEKNVVAYLSAEPYVVTFYDVYGLDVATELSKATITAEDAANAEAIVNGIKEIDDIDFTFVEWRDADGKKVEFPFDVTSNVEIYPYATVTVDFYKDYDEEDNPVDLYKSYTKDFGYAYTDYATDFADLGTPVKEGHSFAGWDTILQGEAYTNETVVATWIVESYKLSFTIDGEVVEGYPVDTAYGTVITVPDAGEKAGFTFSGWNGIPADGKMPASDLTVTGTWVADGDTSYTIETYTMDTNGAYGDPVVETKTAATGTVITYVAPEAGEGLYIDTEKCVLETTVSADTDDVIKVYYGRNKYTVTVDGVAQDAQVYHGATFKAPAAPEVGEGLEFAGWSDGKNVYQAGDEITVTGALDLVKTTTANEYEVVFKVENNIYASTKAAFGTAVTDPGAPGADVIPAGYTFEGWSEDGKTVLTDLGTVKVGGNTYFAVLKANEDTPYEIVKYFQTVDGQGWSDAQVTPKTGTTGELASVDYEAEAVEGFRIDETISKNNVEITGDGNAKVIIYYLRNTVKVTINGETKEYFYGAEIEEPADPSKEGYTFGDAWTYEDGTPATFPIEVKENITLVPVFTVNKYNITFVDGTTTLEGPTEVEYGSIIVAPTAPDKTSEGLVFGGWLDADTGAVMPEKMPAKDATYKANYVQNGAPVKYTIEVYQMNLAGDYELTAKTTASALVGTTQTVEAGEVTGFTFSAADSVLSAVILADGSTTLKVCYARNKYTVTFGANAPVEVYYGATIPVAEDPDAATGMVFAGWSPEVPAAMPAENLVFEATWDVAEYTITYVINGEAKPPVTYEYDAEVETPETPSVPGMKFVKWTPEVPETMPAENLIIVAEFEASVYNVTFRNADGTVFDKKAVKYGDEITLPTTEPTLEHYTFEGWSGIPADGLMPDYDLEVTPIFERVKVMLVPKAGSTTVVDRNGLTVDDYVDGESAWYVYGLEEILNETTLRENFIDVTGDGRIEIVYRELSNGKTFAPYTGTGTVINVYDNVTDELVESFTIIIFGDLNGDSFIQAIDASIAEDEVLMNTDWSDEYSENYKEYMLIAADFDKNGVIKAADTANIENTALGITIINQIDGSVM